MDTNTALLAFAALSQETRLAIFRLLIKAGPEGLAAGAIAQQVDGRQNTISSHLAALSRAGLIESERNGRSIVYHASYKSAGALVAFLLEDCCGGRAEICTPLINNLACLQQSPEVCCD